MRNEGLGFRDEGLGVYLGIRIEKLGFGSGFRINN